MLVASIPVADPAAAGFPGAPMTPSCFSADLPTGNAATPLAPPSARRAYGAQAYGQQQYYGNQGYAPAPQVYYQPRPNYPRQRDFYGNSYQD